LTGLCPDPYTEACQSQRAATEGNARIALARSPSLAPVCFPLALRSAPSFPADTESVRNTLHAVRAEQNAQDRAHDMADLHRLMLTALAANDDIAMIEVLQIARSEMPDAIRTLERALEHLSKTTGGRRGEYYGTAVSGGQEMITARLLNPVTPARATAARMRLTANSS
jgi:hypothetical protein